jgi:hypothetical protein
MLANCQWGAMAALKGEAWWLELTAIKRESTWDLWQVPPEPKGNVFGFASLGHFPHHCREQCHQDFSSCPAPL